MDSNQFRVAAHAAVEEIISYYDTLEDRRVLSDVEPGYLKKVLPDGPPAEGEKWEDIQADIASKIMPGLTHWQSPNFMAFFPASATYPGMLGELYSSAFTCAAFNWICSPAVTELETIVLDWLCTLLHLPACYLSTSPSGGGGVIQGSASEAVVTVMVAARDRYLRAHTAHLPPSEREAAIAALRPRLVALGSEMSHSSVQKAALITGVHFRAVPAPAPASYRMLGPSLAATLAACLASDLHPFFLAATLGTTATCAVDDLAAIPPLLPSHPHLWVHVDAAYAGAALLLPAYQPLTAPMARFDSVDLNLHKWLLVPFDASCLFVRERRHLLAALSITPSYLRNAQSDTGVVTDYRDWQIPLGRRFRALKIWFVMRSYGSEGMKRHVQAGIELGEVFAGLMGGRGDLFEVVAGPAFGLTVLRVTAVDGAREDKDLERESNELTKEAHELVNQRGEIYLTATELAGGKFAIRVVSANPKAEERFVRRAFDVLVGVAEEVREKRRVGPGKKELEAVDAN